MLVNCSCFGKWSLSFQNDYQSEGIPTSHFRGINDITVNCPGHRVQIRPLTAIYRLVYVYTLALPLCKGKKALQYTIVIT